MKEDGKCDRLGKIYSIPADEADGINTGWHREGEMKVNAIVIDLDGTLLNARKQVTPRSIRAILDCHERGTTVIFATARPPRSVRMLLPYELLSLGYMIYYNGALIENATAGIRDHVPIDVNITNKIFSFIAELDADACICVEINDEMFSSRVLTDRDRIILGMPADVPEPALLAAGEPVRAGATKILLPSFGNVYAELDASFRNEVSLVWTDDKQLIQMMGKKVSKQSGLDKVLNRLGLSPAHTMVFGDDYNDLTLFERCGYPVAMENAVEALKERAFHVTQSNDREGVAVVLESLLGGRL